MSEAALYLTRSPARMVSVMEECHTTWHVSVVSMISLAILMIIHSFMLRFLWREAIPIEDCVAGIETSLSAVHHSERAHGYCFVFYSTVFPGVCGQHGFALWRISRLVSCLIW